MGEQGQRVHLSLIFSLATSALQSVADNRSQKIFIQNYFENSCPKKNSEILRYRQGEGKMSRG